MFKERYSDGIDRGIKEGLIEGYEKWNDSYNHLEDFNSGNSRTVPNVLRKLLRAWPGNGEIDILELGPGSGVGLSGVSHLLPKATLNSACGLTPINPWLRFHKDFALSREKNVRAKLYTDGASMDFNVQQLMEWQEKTGYEIFEVLDEPYIHHQSVKHMKNWEPSVQHDLVYDQFGPNWQTHYFDDLQKTWKSAKPDGILFIHDLEEIKFLQSFEGRVDEIEKRAYVIPQINKDFLIVPFSSFLGERIMQEKDRWIYGKPGLIDHFEGFLDEMIAEKS